MMTFRTNFLLQLTRNFSNIHKQYINIKTTATPKHNLYYYTNFIKNYSQKPLKCWQCGIERKNITELFCEQCSYIQAPTEKRNYFKIFELNEEFEIDQKQLTQKYRQMQSLLHPDKFTNKSDTEKDISVEFSSLVNKAYQTLQTPLKRALHLLHLKGDTISEDQKVEDPEFLMEIMELNEEVESANTDAKLKQLKQKNDKELQNITKQIKDYFDSNQITEAKKTIIKMKYYNSVSLHINHLLREKGIVE